MNEIKYTIAEASERLGGISYRTLHYYEQKIGLKINRDNMGNRIYSEYDIELFENIISLKKKGMTLDGIKTLFQEKGILPAEESKNIVVIDEKAFEMKELLLKEIKSAVAEQISDSLNDTYNKLEQLVSENAELREELRKLQHQVDDHYNKIDRQLTTWREEKNKDKNKPWYKKLFSK